MNAEILSSFAQDWTLDHIGVAVRDLTAAKALYTERLGFSLEEEENLLEHKVEVCFVRAGSTTLELLSPLPGNDTLARFLEKRGEGLHHLCFRVSHIEEELRNLAALGARLIDAVPRSGSRNSLVAFLHPSSFTGILLELCQPRV